MIELNSDCWVYGFWYVDGDDKNWLACLSKRDGSWRLDYRFRYYRDDKAHDSDDKKSWYTGKMNGDQPVEKILAAVGQAVAAIEKEYGNKADFLSLECQGDDPKVFFEIGATSWGNPRFESAK